MVLNKNVGKINMFMLLWTTFVNLMIVQFVLAFIPYLLKDKYNVAESDIGKVAGNLGFYGAISVIICELSVGWIMDAFGRKWVTIIGFVTTGVAVSMMPMFDFGVFPYMYILRVFQEMGIVPLINSPFYIDYVHQKSMAIPGALISLISSTAAIFSFCGTLVLQTRVKVGFIFVGFGSLVCLTSIAMCFGLKEVY